MTAFLNVAEFVLIVAAIRLVYVWRHPFRDDGRRRLGAGWAATAHRALLQALDEWRNR